MRTAIFYGSSSENTKYVAQRINSYIDNKGEIKSISNSLANDIESYDFLFLGGTTLNASVFRNDWEDFISELELSNLKGKKVALFTFGDPMVYPDSFGTIYNAIKGKGCEIVGMIVAESFYPTSSCPMVDEDSAALQLCCTNKGKPIDGRLCEWCKSLKRYVS